jgi:uncharacterized protein (DUF433 family)
VNLEDYFQFVAADDIRFKGHRIGIESVLYEYIYRARTPEEIAQRFDTLTLEQIHAAILYYLNKKESMDRYMANWLEGFARARAEQERAHPEFAEKVRSLRADHLARAPTGS